MKIELLVGADQFWNRMRDDLGEARHSAYIQTFTFEGDRVGTRLARALDSAVAHDRRLLVDSYSLLYHSDRLIPGPAWLDRSFRREVMLTHRWVRRLRERGVGVRFGKPLGPAPVRLIRRSHKKVAVFDERVAYLGGINFSDHNFAWHDMMLRVENDGLAALLARDYRAAWDGRSASFDRTVGPIRMISMNGRGNPAAFRPLVESIDGARRSIDVVSAYLSHPFIEHLARARSRGVRVRVLMPDRNNKSNLARHIVEQGSREGFDVLRYPGGMSHMKAMAVDEELLVVGSSNFDFMSYHVLEEHVVMTREPSVVDAFYERVWDPDTAGAGVDPPRSTVGTRLGDLTVRCGAFLAALLELPGGGTGLGA